MGWETFREGIAEGFGLLAGLERLLRAEVLEALEVGGQVPLHQCGLQHVESRVHVSVSGVAKHV